MTFFLIAILLLVIRPDYDPVSRYLSEYAVGWGGWALRMGFLALGLGSLNLVPGFFGPSGPDRGHRVGWPLGLWAVAVMVAAVFPVDLQGEPITGTGGVHLAAAGIAFIALFFAMGLAARSFRRSPGWQRLARPAVWIAVLAPVTFVLLSSVFVSFGWVGVGQWLVFGIAGGWLVLLARHFRRRRERAGA